MIISRTPFRISLFGGGTDYPAWFCKHGGAVLGMAIDKYCYISVRPLPPFFEHRLRIAYSKVEVVREISEIQHPAVRGIMQEMGVNDGLEIHHDADLPARSGLGSSSAFTVGLINALHALRGQMISKSNLGREAIRIEQEVLKESVGCQDQIWAAYGGLNRIDFMLDGGFNVTPLVLKPERRADLLHSLMLVFTGFSRFSSDFAHSQIANIDRRTSQLTTMRQMVDQALDILCDDRAPLRALGELLHESWLLKREIASSVSNPEIDAIYAAAREAGAIGGKLLGAGGGGFMIFMVEPGARQRVRERLDKLIHVAFDFDMEGSKIVLYQPQGL
jgi:D-glycero-alpha-D-manno-heptose-7-phosphate kinase